MAEKGAFIRNFIKLFLFVDLISNMPIHVYYFSRFRLALYVYEYLLHVGAQKSAQTFLSEVSVSIIR